MKDPPESGDKNKQKNNKYPWADGSLKNTLFNRAFSPFFCKIKIPACIMSILCVLRHLEFLIFQIIDNTYNSDLIPN